MFRFSASAFFLWPAVWLGLFRVFSIKKKFNCFFMIFTSCFVVCL